MWKTRELRIFILEREKERKCHRLIESWHLCNIWIYLCLNLYIEWHFRNENAACVRYRNDLSFRLPKIFTREHIRLKVESWHREYLRRGQLTLIDHTLTAILCYTILPWGRFYLHSFKPTSKLSYWCVQCERNRIGARKMMMR